MSEEKNIPNTWDMPQMTKEEAIAFEGWEDMEPAERGVLQLYQDLLCMPFEKFHEGIEVALGRPVFTHEFAFRDELKRELWGDRVKPSDALMVALSKLPDRCQVLIVQPE